MHLNDLIVKRFIHACFNFKFNFFRFIHIHSYVLWMRPVVFYYRTNNWDTKKISFEIFLFSVSAFKTSCVEHNQNPSLHTYFKSKPFSIYCTAEDIHNQENTHEHTKNLSFGCHGVVYSWKPLRHCFDRSSITYK